MLFLKGGMDIAKNMEENINIFLIPKNNYFFK